LQRLPGHQAIRLGVAMSGRWAWPARVECPEQAKRVEACAELPSLRIGLSCGV
jgi:hypothetical protein